MMTYILGRRERECKLLLRGDSAGRLVMWTLPDVNDKSMRLVRQESFDKLPGTRTPPPPASHHIYQYLSLCYMYIINQTMNS